MNNLCKALCLFSVITLLSCGSKSTKPIDQTVLEILHRVPEMNDAEYDNYFAGVSTIKEVIENSNYVIQERDRKNLLEAIEDYNLDVQSGKTDEPLFRRNSRKKFLELFDKHQISDSKTLKLEADFQEDLDDGYIEREQLLVYQDKVFQITIDYISFEGKHYLLGIYRLRCQSGCEPNTFQ